MKYIIKVSPPGKGWANHLGYNDIQQLTTVGRSKATLFTYDEVQVIIDKYKDDFISIERIEHKA